MLLATATFSGESASGWQQVTFSSPVAVTAGTTYVASYHTHDGSLRGDGAGLRDGVDAVPLHAPSSATAGGNGVYLYGAECVPEPDVQRRQLLGRPHVHEFGDGDGAGRADGRVGDSRANALATVGWTAPANNGSAITSYTVTPFIGAVAQATTTITGAPPATSTTITGLTNGTAYTFKVTATNGVGTGPASAASNAVTPSAAVPQTYTLFGATVPAVPDSGDAGANVELGVKFTADISGFVTGVRFYKSAANTGVHSGSLWSSAGVLLATANFSGESASGWQSVTFSSPVAVTAGATYVASYHTTTGHYAATAQGFATAFDAVPLHAPSSPSVGGNGVYMYGASSFPNQTYNATNYWVDVTFSG